MRKGDALAIAVGFVLATAAALLHNSIIFAFICYGTGMYMGARARKENERRQVL